MIKWLCAALLALAHSSAFATDPVSIETKWNVKTFAISTTGVTSLTVDLGGFGSAGYAVIGGTYTSNGIDIGTYGQQLAISSATPNVFGFSYTAFASGGSANMQYTQTLKTPPARGIIAYSTSTANFNSPFPLSNAFTNPLISTSSVINLPSGTPLSGTFEAEVSNPIFYFTSLQAGATLYFAADYGVPKAQ